LSDPEAGRAGTLFVVATPIGNLGDASPRSVEVLKAVDAVAAEDTRRTRKLLAHFGVSARLISYHDHNEDRVSCDILEQLREGADVALVSDAGTPLIADPGYRIVSLCARIGVKVVAIPGPSAAVAALSISGLPPSPFYFAGYLPRKSGQRRTRLAELSGLSCTVVLYESPHRIAATLRDAAEVLGARRAVVARELTKIHEEVIRGTLGELAVEAAGRQLRGEMVVVIGAGRKADGRKPHSGSD
jgi:16S rRNA (cytidine1402-2'-O)-methyltransferase